MKLKYKFSLLMFSFASVTLLASLVFHDRYARKATLQKTIDNLTILTDEVAQRVGVILENNAEIATAIASSPIIEQSLLASNREFTRLTPAERNKQLDSLNQRWMESEDIQAPFIQSYLTNPLSVFLKKQQEIFPGVYGEIFLTNQYGAMIASTSKLTTLAHSHKYWWIAAFQEGKGRIFFDDRGFDHSAQGYVIGVVIPVKKDDAVIGILKCNINIMGPLKLVVNDFCVDKNQGTLKLVRSGGLIVLEQNKVPLSTKVPEDIIQALQKRDTHAIQIFENGTEYVAAYAPINITMGSEKFGFGGKGESIDHILGNIGEGWHTIIFRPRDDIEASANKTTQTLIFFGIINVFIAALIALFLGEKVSRPVADFARAARKLGEGKLDTKITVTSRDEIGTLADSFNIMVANLRHSMASRDELVHEIERRNVAEKEREKLIHELQKAVSEIKTLRGILPICSFCKQIRDDKGYWNQVEKYLHDHTEVKLSHGVCPKCLKKHYPELDMNND